MASNARLYLCEHAATGDPLIRTASEWRKLRNVGRCAHHSLARPRIDGRRTALCPTHVAIMRSIASRDTIAAARAVVREAPPADPSRDATLAAALRTLDVLAEQVSALRDVVALLSK